MELRQLLRSLGHMSLKLLFGFSALRHVEVDTDHPRWPTLAVVQNLTLRGQPSNFSIWPHDAKLMLERSGFIQGLPDRLFYQCQIVWVHPTIKLVTRGNHGTFHQPQQGKFLSIPLDQIGGEIHVPRTHLACRKREPQPFLTLAQRFLHPPAVRDVDLDGGETDGGTMLVDMRHIGAPHISSPDPLVRHRRLKI